MSYILYVYYIYIYTYIYYLYIYIVETRYEENLIETFYVVTNSFTLFRYL